MTPMAQYFTKEILKGNKGDEEVVKRKAVITDLLADSKFFEISGIEQATEEVLKVLGNLSEDPLEAARMAQESTAHLCFLPYPKMWLEGLDFVESEPDPNKFDIQGTGKVRSGFVLEDMGDSMVRLTYMIWSLKLHRGDTETRSMVDVFDCGTFNIQTAVYDYLEYRAGHGTRYQESQAAFAEMERLEVEFQDMIEQGNGVNALIKDEDSFEGCTTKEELDIRRDSLLAESKAIFEAILLKNEELGEARRKVIFPSAILVIRYMLLLNEPKALETVDMDPHKGVLKDIRRVYGDRAPFTDKGWVQVTLHLFESNKTDGRKNGGQGPEAGSVALHFCRRHLRIKRGKLEIVRGHWRGDAAKGLALRSYKVVP